MGVVYRAQDVRLGREVALKFLPPDLLDSPDALNRFRREAELISSLNHPHICTLYDIGEHDGRQFMVMELVQGDTLRKHIAGRPMAIDRAVSIGIDIAEALDAAHAKGIVHRDVKPANVLLSGSSGAKLLDFGIAKRSAPLSAGDLARQATMAATRLGDFIGTPDYMAPEQVRGEPVDARTDVFALGAVLFEMATGRAPFAGPTVTTTVDAVLNQPAPRPTAFNPRVSSDLERIILKALEKDPSLRYQTARDAGADLRRLQRDAPPTPARRWLTLAPALGVLVLLMTAVTIWLLLPRLRGPESTPPAPRATGPARLVVLPFENLTGHAGDDWLAGAFSDAISAGLQPIETLILVPRERVVELYAADSRRESQALSSAIARQVSQQLKVKFYVHGSYERVGEDLRVRARLVDVVADSIQAQETITDRFGNILALEDALAARLAERLGPPTPAVAGAVQDSVAPRVTTGAPVVPPPAPMITPPATGPSDLRAYQLVTDARAHYALGEWDKARPLLDEAVKRDPNYAMAWATLSKTHSRAISPASAAAPDPALRTAALREALIAVKLAPTLVEAHIAVALAHRSLGQRDALRTAAEQAVRLKPRNGEARILLGDALSISPGFGCPVDARPEDAVREYREALRIDPLEASGYGNLTTVLWWMGRPVEALQTQEAARAEQPRHALNLAWMPFNMVFAGKVDEAEALLAARSKPPIPGRDEAIHGYIALARKQFDQADARFAAADAKGVFGNLALTLITSAANFQAGRADQGGAYLARGIRAAPGCAAWAMQVPVLAPYRATPAFKAAVGSAKR